MAKRTRGSSRPGRRPPLPRERRAGTSPRPALPPTAPGSPPDAPVRRATGLTADEEARAAEIEARILAEERAAEQASRRSRERSRAPGGGPARELAPLSVRAASEYAYVRRDIVRISRIGGSLLIVLAILHVLINVAGVIRI